MAAAVAAFAISALGVSAAAAGSGKVMIVQGRPGPAVDICINGKEVKSKLRYGKKAFKKLGAGFKKLKVYKKDPRRCRGVKLAQKGFALPAGSDLTIVITRKKPRKILVLDNAKLGVLPAAAFGSFALRHAADIGPVTFKVDTDEITKPPIAPAADPVWLKGDQHAVTAVFVGDKVWTTSVTRPDSDTPIFGPYFTYTEPVRSRRYELILVGSKVHNLKLVTARRLVTFSAP